MKTTKIGIVGYGYVGKAMAKLFEKNYEVLVYDVTPGIITDSARHHLVDKEEINQCDLGVICVPTPRGTYGECDITHVEHVLEWLSTPQILLKSTVAVGTTDALSKKYSRKIVFSPEYCGESTYWTPYDFHTDIKETPFFIFGGNKKACSRMVDLFMPVTGPTKTYRMTDARTAEMVKYMENTFYATKIAFCYEIDQVCKTMRVDYNEARDLWLLDPRINPMHTAVFDANDKPFSGKCLPKDLSALVSTAKAEGYDARLLQEVLSTNDRIAEIRAVTRGESK
jgi:UDPglucose 6-dehydrogenase